MKKQEIKAINEMRLQGKAASEIAWVLDLSVHTVRSHIRRHPELYGGKPCKNCGKVMAQPVGRKVKHFCSDKCRMAWWNSHREQVQKKAYYTLTCVHCGKESESYGNQKRKYCSRDCYFSAQRHSAKGSDPVPGVPGGSEHHVA